MQKTSEIYKELLEAQQLGDPNVKFQTRLTIGESGVLITKQGDSITFGSKAYTKTATGSTIVLTETEDRPLAGLKVIGKTTQNGTPSPDDPVPLDSVGADGSVAVKVCGKNLFDESKIENKTYPGRYAEFADGRIHFVNNDAVGYVATARLTLTPGTYYLGSSIQTVTGVPTVGYKINSNPSTYATNTFVTLTETSQFELRATTSGTNTSGEYYANFWITAGESATSYEPYKETQTLSISTPNGLAGIPVASGGNYTDESGQQWICDEVDFEKGVYVQRVANVTFNDATGWEMIGASGGGTRFRNRSLSIPMQGATDHNVKANLLCSAFPTLTANQTWYKSTGISGDHTQMLIYYDAIEQTTSALGAYFVSNPMTVVYQMATPIETALSAEQLAAFTALRTYQPNTTVFNDSGACTEIKYTMNGDGPSRILTGVSGADSGYDETVLISMETDARVFSEDTPEVGASISSQIDIEMIKPFAELPKQARLVPYVRLSDGLRHSEWIQKGVYYIDTRSKVEDGSSIEKIVLHGYDDMLKAEQDYPESTLSWPAKDLDVVREIAEFIGVAVDDRTVSIMNRGYTIQYPTGYSCRDVLGYIAAMYAGSFIMSDLGDLRLVTIYGIPKETRYLIEPNGYVITFGGDRILV